MTELYQLVDALRTHQWILVASLVIGLLVRLWKSGKFEPYTGWLPKNQRWLVAIVLGFVAAVLQAVLLGTPWATALLDGLISAVIAIAGHQAVIEGARGGRELGAPKPGGGVTLAGIVLLSLGCGSALDAAVHTANASGAVLKATRTEVLARFKAEQETAALAVEGKAAKRLAVQRVRRTYAPVLAAYEAALAVWRSAVAAIRVAQAAEASSGEVRLADVLAVVSALDRAVAKVVALSAALDDEPEKPPGVTALDPAPSSPGVAP